LDRYVDQHLSSFDARRHHVQARTQRVQPVTRGSVEGVTVQATSQNSLDERTLAQRMPLMRTTIAVHAHALFVAHDE
jgi:hypothetical protein